MAVVYIWVDLMEIHFLLTFQLKKPFLPIPYTESIYKQYDIVEDLNQSEFKKLLLSATKEYYFNFNESLYKRIDGVEQWLEQCPDEFKPVYYRSNVDAIIVLFKSQDNRTKFRDYLNKCHPDI